MPDGQLFQSTTQAEISAKNYIFKASGYTVTFDGVYSPL